MKCFRPVKLSPIFFCFLVWSLFPLPGLKAQGQEKTPSPAGAEYFSQIFTEKILTVSREGDGILPGTLRTALIQASGIRAQNSFTLVKIVFDPTVKRVRITKGILPEIDGSLTTIDCQIPSGRALIEGAQESTEGQDPSEEVAGLKLTSNGNTVRNCHITGFRGPGILIKGNRNVLEYNTVGYHKDIPESTEEASSVYEEPKTNQGAGILISNGSSENLIQNNEIIANTLNGIQLSQGVGTGNKMNYNIFAKNSGKPIKVLESNQSTVKPQITKISQEGELYIISGISEPGAEIQLYLSDKDENVGMNVMPGLRSSQENFTLATKSKGFIPNQTYLIALAHGQNHNTSEFSGPILIPLPGETSTQATTQEVEKIKAESPDEPRKTSTPEPKEERQNPAGSEGSESETVINIHGAGDKGGDPDGGSLTAKNPEASALGI
jgi:parallel beta helix pectate lyase-like protein